jgi:hypothetical protein
MSEQPKPTGAKAMLARGFMQVTFYLPPKDAVKLMKVAERTGRKRSNVVLGMVLDALKKEGK